MKQATHHRRTTAAVTAALTAQPGLTRQRIHELTHISLPTVALVLDRVATPVPGTWPREWKLKSSIVDPIIVTGDSPVDIPLEKGWASWARAVMSWPNAIGRLSRSTDPREIANGLAAMARTASALSLVFSQVADEPDWLERIGGAVPADD